MTREEALLKLEEPLYEQNEIEMDIVYFCKKLRINRAEFDELMAVPIHHYTDFPNWEYRYRLLKKGQALVERITGKRRSVYS